MTCARFCLKTRMRDFGVAGITLLERAGANVIGCSFVIDLPELGGAERIRKLGKPVHALVAFEGH